MTRELDSHFVFDFKIFLGNSAPQSMVKMPMLTHQIYILQTYVYFFYISVLFYHCEKKEANVLKTI